MPSRVVCNAGHSGGLCQDAAIEISVNGHLGNCACGEQRRYLVSQHYPFYDVTREYELESVKRIHTDEQAEEEGYDPMVFVLRDRHDNNLLIWPFYWTKNRHQRWHVGQFPPLLPVEPLRQLLSELEPPRPQAQE